MGASAQIRDQRFFPPKKVFIKNNCWARGKTVSLLRVSIAKGCILALLVLPRALLSRV